MPKFEYYGGTIIIFLGENNDLNYKHIDSHNNQCVHFGSFDNFKTNDGKTLYQHLLDAHDEFVNGGNKDIGEFIRTPHDGTMLVIIDNGHNSSYSFTLTKLHSTSMRCS
jgi:hypothetical protein